MDPDRPTMEDVDLTDKQLSEAFEARMYAFRMLVKKAGEP